MKEPKISEVQTTIEEFTGESEVIESTFISSEDYGIDGVGILEIAPHMEGKAPDAEEYTWLNTSFELLGLNPQEARSKLEVGLATLSSEMQLQGYKPCAADPRDVFDTQYGPLYAYGIEYYLQHQSFDGYVITILTTTGTK